MYSPYVAKRIHTQEKLTSKSLVVRAKATLLAKYPDTSVLLLLLTLYLMKPTQAKNEGDLKMS